MCGNESKQRHHPGYKKEDSASPIVFLEGVLITAAIKTHEDRGIAYFNIPGTFLYAKYEDDDVFLLLRGKLAKLMVDPNMYHQYVY